MSQDVDILLSLLYSGSIVLALSVFNNLNYLLDTCLLLSIDEYT
jgi:hypothetical protein